MRSQLRLLGVPVLECNGEPTHVPRRKALALLAYLAVTGGRHQRESLATTLWPESRAEPAHAALRNLLWCLRKTPVSSVLHSNRSAVWIEKSNILTVDANRFRDLTRSCPSKAHGSDAACAVCEPLLAEAVRLWNGPFMSGFGVANSILFEDWQFAEGAALQNELSQTLDRLVEYYTPIEDWEAVERCARQWLQIDELNEAAYRALMRCYSAKGNRSEALRTYEQCRRTLKDSLGVSPEEATIDLAETIRMPKRNEPRSAATRASRLPPVRGRIIGREEIAERVERLLLGSTRAVSLVGLGGVGKTSVALHVARRLEDRFAQGAALIALDSLHGGIPLASAVRAALSLAMDRPSDASPEERIADALQNHQLLIILDGAETFAAQTLRLVELLTRAPGVRVLITSRIEVNAPDIVSVPLLGLACPPANEQAEHLPEYPATRLLRISSERHGVPPSGNAADLHDMSDLARLLEGTPLALEMAAGWRSVLTWKEIGERVRSNLDFLVHRDTNVSPRHRTLAATFDQSWDLLTADGRAALARMSVFRGPFTIRAAEHVAGTHAGALATLTSRCLLIRVGPNHYRMHELLRQFAEQKLAELESTAEHARSRHIAHYAAAVAEWFENLTGANQYSTLLTMEQEIENVRFAFQSAAANGDSARIREAGEGLFAYYTMRTLLPEGESVFAAASLAYREHADRDAVVDAFLRIAAGWFASWDWPDLAAQRRAEGIALLPKIAPTDRFHALASIVYANACFGAEHDENLLRLRQCLVYFRNEGDRIGEADALEACAALEHPVNAERSEELYKQCVQLRREIGDACGEGVTTFSLAQLAEERGDLELALSRYEAAERLNAPYTKDAFGVISILLARSRVNGRLGDAEASLHLAQQALVQSRGYGHRFQIGRSLTELARATRAVGDNTSARELLEESFDLLAPTRFHDLQARNARMLAEIALDKADVGAAERWLEEAVDLDPDNDDIPALETRVLEIRTFG